MTSVENTRRIFLNALAELSDIPFDKITVTMICEHAQMSRQTFYQYFKDKYEMTEYLVQKVLGGNFDQLGKTVGWNEAYFNAFSEMVRYASVLRSIGEDSGNYNSIVPFTTRAAEKDFTDRYEERYGSAPSPLIAFQIHWTAVLGSAVPTKWMKDGCAMSARELADMFTALIPQELFKALNVD